MSIFIYKIIIAIFMSLDHIGAVFVESLRWDVFQSPFFYSFRNFGRIVFPLVAFNLVIGFIKTRDVDKYINRLSILTIVSQVPFVLTFYMPNLMVMDNSESMFHFRFALPYIIIAIISLGLHLVARNKRRLEANQILILVAFLLLSINLKINGIWVLAQGFGNTIYILLVSVVLLKYLTSLNELTPIKKVLEMISLLLLIFLVYNVDYGLAGIVLICALYIFRRNIKIQGLVIIIWSFLFYGITNYNYTSVIFSSIAGILVMLYNGEKGKSVKKATYYFYPAHLIILGIVNILYKFGFLL